MQDDAKAREGGYDGPSPLEATLKPEEVAARTAAISRGQSVRLCGGRETVEKQLKKPLTQVTDAELSTLHAIVQHVESMRRAHCTT